MHFKRKLLFIISIISTLFYFSAAKAEIKVVTSIKPIHSLVSYIMDGVGTPDLIVDGYNSPHGFSLKPSHAKILQEADMVVYVGEGIEEFLEKPLESISKNSVKFELMNQSGIKKLKFRERNIFGDHDDHGHGKKKKDDHDDHDEHDKKAKKDDHDDHGHGEFDPHIWLDPMNAKIIVKKVTNQLSKLDNENSSIYKSNSKKALKEIDKLIKEVKSSINKDAKAVVFHDAYQYFEKRFNVNIIGALTVNTDVLPGAEQLAEIREVIEHEKVTCVLSEPQFNPDIVKTIANDTKINSGVLDPLGANLNKGKDLYFNLIKNISASLKNC
ncbi:MAG: zinc ABC transporter substrate-binding protein [Candidatus Pelagibacter sp. TMED273]|nr:MAG: zinc ABC transporter substrate-binding protein [Candidatus Pelagibacter sp. TMED273]